MNVIITLQARCMIYFVYLLPYFHSGFISILRRYKFIQVIIVHYSYCNSMVVVWNNSVLVFADNCSINEQYTQDDIIPRSFHQSTYHCVDFYKNKLLIDHLWEWRGWEGIQLFWSLTRKFIRGTSYLINQSVNIFIHWSIPIIIGLVAIAIEGVTRICP